MDYSSIFIVVILFFVAFTAGFTDAVVGGGGLIQVPMMFILFPELSHVQVIATNRFASIFGTTVSAIQYARRVGIFWETVIPAGIAACIGSFSGTFVMAIIPTEVFKPILLVIIILLTIYTFMKKDFGQSDWAKFTTTQSKIFAAIGIGLIIGLYNGIIGPGTGVLLVFSLVSILGKDFLKASASAKTINAVADGGSLIGFILSGAVLYKYAIPMLVGNVVGSYIGSNTAIKKGNSFVRYFFLMVVSLLILRLAWDIFKTN